jgi:hypothetical protein
MFSGFPLTVFFGISYIFPKKNSEFCTGVPWKSQGGKTVKGLFMQSSGHSSGTVFLMEQREVRYILWTEPRLTTGTQEAL